MRKTLTDRQVAALKPRQARYSISDPDMTGHIVRVMPSGAKTFTAVARDPNGKQIWSSIGAADVMKIAEARELARTAIKRIRAGLSAVEVKPDSVGDVVAKWLKIYAEPKGLRTLKEIRRVLNSYVLPVWRDRDFVGIKRSDITKLMDNIADKHGARSADYTLSVFSRVANWHAARIDDYRPPMIRNMRRQSTEEQARTRVLDDAEIRAVWKAAESCGTFGAIIRIALLTAQRRTKISQMRREDVSDDGAWTIATESAREKDTGGTLELPEAALEIIRAQPHIAGNPHVFAGRGHLGPFKGWAPSKTMLDAKLPAGTPPWVIHDLRRTARSLMSRAGVRPDIAEKVMGHAVGGVRGTYDRHKYLTEKGDALARLAMLVDSIVNSQDKGGNVLSMPKRRTRK